MLSVFLVCWTHGVLPTQGWKCDKQRSESSGFRDVGFWFFILPSSRNIIFLLKIILLAEDTL